MVLTWSSSPFFWSFSQPFLPFPSSPQPLPRCPRCWLCFWAVYASDRLHWTSCALGGVKRHVGGRCGWWRGWIWWWALFEAAEIVRWWWDGWRWGRKLPAWQNTGVWRPGPHFEDWSVSRDETRPFWPCFSCLGPSTTNTTEIGQVFSVKMRGWTWVADGDRGSMGSKGKGVRCVENVFRPDGEGRTLAVTPKNTVSTRRGG